MGIDPVTHEPLHKETKAEDNLPPDSSNQQKAESSDGTNNNVEDNSSSSPTENSSSTDDSLLLENICNDDCLLNSLWIDEPPLIDAPWNISNQPVEENINETGLPVAWDHQDNCSWLLDCQDFGIHDFGIDCFSDFELNTLNNLEVGGRH